MAYQVRPVWCWWCGICDAGGNGECIGGGGNGKCVVVVVVWEACSDGDNREYEVVLMGSVL